MIFLPQKFFWVIMWCCLSYKNVFSSSHHWSHLRIWQKHMVFVLFQIRARQRSWQWEWRCLLWLIAALHAGHLRHEEVLYPCYTCCSQGSSKQNPSPAVVLGHLPWLWQRQGRVLRCRPYEVPVWMWGGLLWYNVPSVCFDGRCSSASWGSCHSQVQGVPRRHLVQQSLPVAVPRWKNESGRILP